MIWQPSQGTLCSARAALSDDSNPFSNKTPCVETTHRGAAEASLGRRHQLTLNVEQPEDSEFDEYHYQRSHIGNPDPILLFATNSAS